MDTVGIWAAALPSALMMVIVMLGVATIDTLGGGWTARIDPPTSSKKTAESAHPPLGITTDVTPLKIVGLNNYT